MPKNFKNNQYGFHTEKDLKSKNFKDVNKERKFEFKAITNRPEKGRFFGAVKVKLLGLFLQNVHLITKYLLPEKISLVTSLQAEIKGGGGQPFSFGPAF